MLQGEADLKVAYLKVRAFTEKLAMEFSAEDRTVRSMPDVSLAEGHRSHTPWFFESLLLSREVRAQASADCLRMGSPGDWSRRASRSRGAGSMSLAAGRHA